MPTIIYRGESCELRLYRYTKPANICLRLTTLAGEPMATATVNLDYLLPAGIVAIKDYAENMGMLAALVAASVVADTGRVVPVGFACANICNLLVK